MRTPLNQPDHLKLAAMALIYYFLFVCFGSFMILCQHQHR